MATIIQTNLNHCRAAQDLLMQSMAMMNVELSIMAEPYSIPDRPTWYSDQTNKVAIYWRGIKGSPLITEYDKGKGYIAVLWGTCLVIGTYISPNIPLIEFEGYLRSIGNCICSYNGNRVLLMGDMNAKAVEWGSPKTDARGNTLIPWAAGLGLKLINQGTRHTCVRKIGGSIVDLTWASPRMERVISNWRVADEIETVSDHKYIVIQISSVPYPKGITERDTRRGENYYPKWAVHKMNKDALITAALVKAWTEQPEEETVEVEEEVTWLGDAMTQICDMAMPRIKAPKPHRQVYWWSDEIANLRQECVRSRRKYTRQRRRRNTNVEREIQLYEIYKEDKNKLQLAIRKAKTQAWEELLETLDKDPWGRPFKIVMNKLRGWAPPVTEMLDPQFLRDVVEILFPRAEKEKELDNVNQSSDIYPFPADDCFDGDSHCRNTYLGDGRSRRDISFGEGSRSRDNQSSFAHHGLENIPEEPRWTPEDRITAEEFSRVLKKMEKGKKAPGPDGIPGKAWILTLSVLGDRVRHLFDRCLEEGIFPALWKKAKLVLLHKAGKPVNSPRAYRPICLLNEIGKILERIIAGRLIQHLSTKGPDLNENQFGFRTGRSTLDAIEKVRANSEEMAARGKVSIAISLDIKNAFNTLPWDKIKEALSYHKIPEYMRRIIDNYLTNREIEILGRYGKIHRRTVNRGVPQGSVLGPILWDIGYDKVLRTALFVDSKVVCYADDTLLLIGGDNWTRTVRIADIIIARILAEIKKLGLEVSPQKTEMIWFRGKSQGKPPPTQLMIGGVPVQVGENIKYLGLVLDGSWNFKAHFEDLITRVQKAAARLSRLLPNLGGPKEGARRLYVGVVHSIALYGAPIWASALGKDLMGKRELSQVFRQLAIRVIRGYRTISGAAAEIMAGVPPIELMAEERASSYIIVKRIKQHGGVPTNKMRAAILCRSRKILIKKWRRQLLESKATENRTVHAILPNLEKWLDRKWGGNTYRMTQMLSGHGCFGEYLGRIGKEIDATCHHCNGDRDTAQHTLEECPAWAEERRVLVQKIGGDLKLESLITAILQSENAWVALSSFCETVITQKEKAERERERENPDRQRGKKRKTQQGGSNATTTTLMLPPPVPSTLRKRTITPRWRGKTWPYKRKERSDD